MKAPSLRSQLGYLADGAKVGIGDPELALESVVAVSKRLSPSRALRATVS